MPNYNNQFQYSKILINWFWKELEIASRKNYRTLYSFMKDGTYQSGTEELIELSSDPDKMRSFLLIGVLIDQMMYTHTYVVYGEFERVFKYPKINAEYGEGMTGPNWVISEYHGHNKKVNWNTTEEISKFLFVCFSEFPKTSLTYLIGYFLLFSDLRALVMNSIPFSNSLLLIKANP